MGEHVTETRQRHSSRVSIGSTSRLSFNGSIRLNDLLNEESDEYGFNSVETAEEAEEIEEKRDARQKGIKFRESSTEKTGIEISDSDSAVIERASIGSNHSTESSSVPKEQSKLGQLIDKAKKKLGEKKKEPTPDLIDEASQCVLLEVTTETQRAPTPKPELESSSDPFAVSSLGRHCRSMPFFHQRLFFLGILIAITCAFPGFLTGLLWGIYISFIGFLYFFVSDPHPKKHRDPVVEEFSDVEIAEEAHEALDTSGLGEGVVYKGWLNELRSRYHPASYHVNNTQSVLVRLENSTLRISRPAKSVLKHAFHTDPTLTQPMPTMTAQTIYDLTDAKISLRPRRLAARRWWSRKYPIQIRFSHRGSALAEVDLMRTGMSRSASMHQNANSRNELPLPPGTLSEIFPASALEDSTYDAESDSSSDESEIQSSSAAVLRSSSAGDLSEFSSKSKGCSNKNKGRSIYLFFRAAREKERWFHLLREACSKARKVGSVPGGLNTLEEEPSSTTTGLEHEFMLYKINHIQFAKQLLGVMVGPMTSPEPGSTVSVDLGSMKWRQSTPENNSELVSSVHAIASRIFFDFCRDKYWSKCVKEKIQAKISTVHLPYFIEKLELSELDLGTNTPSIVGVYSPKMDEWGLWVDFELRYKGSIRLVLQTSVNLLKLHSGHQQVETARKVSRWTDSVRVSNHSDPDLPESPESSPDEDFGSNNAEISTKERTGKKILSIVERAAQSSLVQKVVKLKKVEKLMKEVSSTPLILNVSVEVVEGTMTINLPPPPSDRLWYAFRKPPTLNIKAVPQVGDRSVDMTTVSDWIEAKLRLLVEKNLVCPNMDDIILPVMSGNALLHMGYNK
ncbi:unnamed protein product, partial [Mesorhabditis belari]|uniref:SMP-LTD domain-containing protein n=1 Tax=Mesorhabditis belari TaxID=2138241 RepID=A0AAF3F4N4_9BILA